MGTSVVGERVSLISSVVLELSFLGLLSPFFSLACPPSLSATRLRIWEGKIEVAEDEEEEEKREREVEDKVAHMPSQNA